MTQTEIKASVLHGPKDLRVTTRQIDQPAGDEVQIAVKSTTLCGSDMHYYVHGANGDFKVREPLTLGHESAGVVTAVGSAVEDLKVGDKVALEVGIPCNNCKQCRTGHYNLCQKLKFRSSAKVFPHFQGTLQERINCPAVWCHRLPDSIPVEQAALLEPLAVAIHASNRAALAPGSSVLILGAGAVGLLAAAMAKIRGATTITIADIASSRVDFAVKNGFATNGITLPAKRASTTEDKVALGRELSEIVTSEVDKLTGKPIGEYDVTFECTGVESCVQAGIFATAPGGKLMFVGMGQPIQTLHIGAAALREVDLLGVFRYSNAYPMGINLMASGLIPAVDKLITHRVQGLDKVEEAFKLAGKPQDDEGNLVIKVAILS